MEEYPSTMNNEPHNPKPNRLTSLAFLEVGLFEFFFVAIVLFLLFGTLNYFNILPISSVFPKYLSWLPRMSSQETPPTVPIQTTPTPTPTFLSNPLVAKAKDLGYNIIKIDSNDTTGRTAFYKNRATTNNEGIGIKKYKNVNNKEFTSQIIGTFENLQGIPNSSDKYLLLTDPDTKKEFPLIRILMNFTDASTESIPTQLIVEDLSYNGDNVSLSAYSMGSFRQFSEKDTRAILHKGDSVAVGLKTGPQGNTIDENEHLESLVLFIRRFGGKIQIEKEVERKL